MNNEPITKEEFLNFLTIENSNIQEIRERILNTNNRIVDGVENIEFIFRIDHITDLFNEMIEKVNVD